MQGSGPHKAFVTREQTQGQETWRWRAREREEERGSEREREESKDSENGFGKYLLSQEMELCPIRRGSFKYRD